MVEEGKGIPHGCGYERTDKGKCEYGIKRRGTDNDGFFFFFFTLDNRGCWWWGLGCLFSIIPLGSSLLGWSIIHCIVGKRCFLPVLSHLSPFAFFFSPPFSFLPCFFVLSLSFSLFLPFWNFSSSPRLPQNHLLSNSRSVGDHSKKGSRDQRGEIQRKREKEEGKGAVQALYHLFRIILGRFLFAFFPPIQG